MPSAQDLADSLQEQNDAKAEAQKEQIELDTLRSIETGVSQAVKDSTTQLIAHDKSSIKRVKVENDLTIPQLNQVISALQALTTELKPEPNDDSNVINAINRVAEGIDAIPKELPDSPEPVEEVTVKNIKDLEPQLKKIVDAVNKLKLNPTFDPQIKVSPTPVKITQEKTDVKPVVDAVNKLLPALEALNKPDVEPDLTPIVEASQSTTQAIQALRFPVPNYVLPFIKDGKDTQVTLNSDGTLPMPAASFTPAKDTDRFGIQAISNDGTYKYFFFEADDADYYIMRKHITNKTFSYTAGTGGYAAVYQSSTLGPSGSPTWGDRGTIF